MCGIFGIFTKNKSADFDERLKAAFKALRHRGPDDRGLEIVEVASGALALGHTRLSIIDLSPGGHQPMHSADGRYTIVFNGEIYNYLELRQELRSLGHEFYTESDTVVLLACWGQWGPECLTKLVGMFAFAIYDSNLDTLTCARDAFGIKPFFYSCCPKSFMFASEIPALLTLIGERPRLDWQRSYDYLVFGDYDSQERTFIENIRHLLPGHLMTFDMKKGELSQPQPWFSPKIEESFTGSFDDAAEILREVFLHNIRLHLRSDVPFGVGLSGGIDSSAVAAGIRKIEPDIPIHTFSYVARGTPVSEEDWVDTINDYVHAEAHKVLLTADELVQDLDDMIRAQGEPFGTTSIYAQYRVFKTASEHGITVVLDGQGADELLAGYDGYPGYRMRSMIEQGQILRALRFASSWSRWPGRRFVNVLTHLGSEICPDNVKAVLRRIVRGVSLHPNWLNIGILKEAGVKLRVPRHKPILKQKGRRLAGALAVATFSIGLPALLRHGDRNSMRFSVESRVPFLTLPLVRFVLSLPESYLLSYRGETKSVFRAAMRGIVPDKVLDRRDKIGFATPQTDWLVAETNQIREYIASPVAIPFLNQEVILDLFAKSVAQNKPIKPLVWRWVNFIRWATIMNIC